MTCLGLLVCVELNAQTTRIDHPGKPEPGDATMHCFLAVDDGTHTLHYVNQNAPPRNWKTPFGNYCMDMQLIGDGRVLLAVDDGYREFELATGKELRMFKGLGGKTHTVERLADGRTLLGGTGLGGVKDGFIVLDTKDNVASKVPVPELSYIRHLRSTPRGTLVLAAVGRVAECTIEGKILWSAPVPGNNFKAVELDADRVLVSCGPGGRTLREIDHKGKALSETTGKDLTEGSFCGFQWIAHDHLVVANWLGHGPDHDGTSLVEYNAEGKVVWTYDAKHASFVEVIILDGLDPGVLHTQQGNARIAPDVAPKPLSPSPGSTQSSDTPRD
jgi:hypothetical protein